MRAAPPVSVRCTGGRVWAVLLVATPALAAAAAALWLAAHLEVTAWLASAFALAMALAAAALAYWRLPAPGNQLGWDGQAWQVDGQVGRLAVMIDLGPWLLLRMQPSTAGRASWLPVASVEPRASWHALRAALYCRSSMAAAPAAPSSPSPQSD